MSVDHLSSSLKDLITCVKSPNYTLPEPFFLDSLSPESRRQVFSELNRLIKDFDCNGETLEQGFSTISFQDTTLLKEYEQLTSNLFAAFFRKNQHHIFKVIEDSAGVPVEKLPKEVSYPRIFEFTRNILLETLIASLFSARYQIENPYKEQSSEALEQQRSLLTYTSRLSNRDTHQARYYEQSFNESGLFFGHYPGRSIREGDVHVFDAHGEEGELASLDRFYPMDVQMEGGNILLNACNQNAEKAQQLLRKIEKQDMQHPPSGAIHLAIQESLYPVSAVDGIVITSESRFTENHPERPNPFVRTTQQQANQDFEGSTHIATTGQPMYIKRSPSKNSLYVGAVPDYFENRFAVLKNYHEKQMQLFKHDSQITGQNSIYDIPIDFERLKSLDLNEKQHYNLHRFMFSNALYSNLMGDMKTAQHQIFNYRLFYDYISQGSLNSKEPLQKEQQIEAVQLGLNALVNNSTVFSEQLTQQAKVMQSLLDSNMFIKDWSTNATTQPFQSTIQGTLETLSPEVQTRIKQSMHPDYYNWLAYTEQTIDHLLAKVKNPEVITALARFKTAIKAEQQRIQRGELLSAQLPRPEAVQRGRRKMS